MDLDSVQWEKYAVIHSFQSRLLIWYHVVEIKYCDTVSTLNQIPTDMHVCLKDSSEREIFFIAMSP